MKRIMMGACIVAISTAAHAAMITIESATDTEVDVMVKWDQSGLGTDVTNDSRSGPNVWAQCEPYRNDQYTSQHTDSLSLAITSQLQSSVWLTVTFKGGFALSDATLSYSIYSSTPASVTPAPDGYGLEFTIGAPDRSGAIPDGGSSLLLAGFGLGACLTASRRRR